MSSENPKMDEIRRSVAESYNRVTELVKGRLRKLDHDLLYLPPAENEWSVMQSLAHIVEIMPYWANEVEKLAGQPGQKFGRVMTDEARLRAIDDHAGDELHQAEAALPGSYARLKGVLDNLTDADLAKSGVHSKYGEKPLEWFIREFVTYHLKNHLTQLHETLVAISHKHPDGAD
jgi:uncharacterized damage-inducible protein DinB